MLKFFVESHEPAFTAREVGDEFGHTRQWADKRLSKLESEGYLDSKNPGGRAKFYWITEAGKRYLKETRT